MIKITNTNTGDTFEYAYVEDFLTDVIGDEDVQDWLDELYDPIEICSERFGAGFILRKCLGSSRWTEYVDDFVRFETEYIEDECASNGTCDWREYFIEDTDYTEEE